MPGNGSAGVQMATGHSYWPQGLSKQQDRGARDSEGRADGDQETRLLPEAHWPHMPHDQLPSNLLMAIAAHPKGQPVTASRQQLMIEASSGKYIQ